jgi:hypothetical protein
MNIEIISDESEILGGANYIAYLEISLNEDGDAAIITSDRHNSNNGTPIDEWHMRTLTWGNSLSQGTLVVADRAAVEALAEKIRPLLERVHAGHSVKWDGSNMRGALDDDASEAQEEINRLVEEYRWTSNKEVWDASEWVSAAMDTTAEELGLTADATDADKNRAAQSLLSWAKGDNVLIKDVDEAIQMLVDHLIDQAA